MARSKREVKELVAKLDRGACQQLLEGVGIAVYDHEKVGTLRTAVVVNVLDSTIPLHRVQAAGGA